MPTGFDDIESGAELSNRLRKLIPWLEESLKAAKPFAPRTAKDLCYLCSSQNRIEIEGPDIRAMVNFLRRDCKPVASVADGYFWATERQQLDSTILHLSERIAGISSALRGLEQAKKNLTKGQQELL